MHIRTSLECKLHDVSMAGKYNLFIFKVVKAWVDTARKNPATFHHRGGEDFILAGKTVKLRAPRRRPGDRGLFRAEPGLAGSGLKPAL